MASPFELSKDWYKSRLDLYQMHKNPDDTENRDGLWRDLPADSLAHAVRTTFRHYSAQAERFALNCIKRSDLPTALEFLGAHREIIKTFDFAETNYYIDMADIIVRQTDRMEGYKSEPNTPPKSQACIPPVFDFSDDSAPPTPCTTLSWVNKLDPDCAFNPSPGPISDEPKQSPAASAINPLTPPTTITGRRSYPRKAKTARAKEEAESKPQGTRKETSVNNKASTKEPVASAQKPEPNRRRGKRRISEDAEALLEDKGARKRKKRAG